MRCEGVTEQVRMDSFRFEPGLGRQVAQDQEGAGASEPAAFRVEEELGPVPRVQERASPSQVTPQCLCGLPADRDDSLLRALADAANDACVEVDARLLKAHGLADPQAGAVQQLDESAVTQRARAARQVELGRWIVGAYAEEGLVPEERADRGDTSRDRRRRQSCGA